MSAATRASIVASVDSPDDVRVATDWFQKWGDQLTYKSDQKGCGCCVLWWDVEAPPLAIAEIPQHVRAATEWSPMPKLFTGRRHHRR